MKIIELSQTQYKNYANIHDARNFGQTIEFSMIVGNIDKRKLFLGLIDENNYIHAATLILITNKNNIVREAYAPDGFLIDYTDFNLLTNFTCELTNYLKKYKITYLITNPMYKHRVYNKENIKISDNINILNNFLSLNYQNIGYQDDFEKYDVIIENYNSCCDIYKSFNRNTKRNIQEGINYGITLHKGNINDIDKAYDLFKKKSLYNLSFYKNLMEIYKNDDNKMEIFFAKLNPHRYLVNSKKLYEDEYIRNQQIHDTCNRNIGHITDKLLNKKINSDAKLEKHRINLKHAIDINNKYNDSIIIGTSIIIRNNQEIYFLIDGYQEEFRNIHSTHILKWAIIKKYFEKGYRIFNLGEVYKDYLDNNKYHGQYMYKAGFGGDIIEYPPNLLLVLNKSIYNTYNKINKIRLLKK